MDLEIRATKLAQERLRQVGLRLTAPRRAVLDVLTGTERALTLKEILDRARERRPSLGLTTVYRTVELLQELGLVGQVKLERENCQRYFLMPPGHWHQLVCLGCGRLVHFPGKEYLADLQRELESETGFRIKRHLLQFYGYCPDHRGGTDAQTGP